MLVSCKAVSILPSPFLILVCRVLFVLFFFFLTFFQLNRAHNGENSEERRKIRLPLGEMSVLLPEVSWSL